MYLLKSNSENYTSEVITMQQVGRYFFIHKKERSREVDFAQQIQDNPVLYRWREIENKSILDWRFVWAMIDDIWRLLKRLHWNKVYNVGFTEFSGIFSIARGIFSGNLEQYDIQLQSEEELSAKLGLLFII